MPMTTDRTRKKLVEVALPLEMVDAFWYLAVVWGDGDLVSDQWMGADPLRGEWSFAMTSMNLDIGKLRKGSGTA